MRLRKPVAARFHKFKRHTENHEYHFSELELYHIFKDDEERQRCHEDHAFCLRVFLDHKEEIDYVKAKAMPFLANVEDAFDLAEELVNEDDIGEELDPSKLQDDEDCLQEGNEDTETFVAHDFDKIADDPMKNDKLFKRIEVEDLEILLRKTRELDADQALVIEMVVDYCKKFKRSAVTGEMEPDPLLLKILGSAGTGKSHVIDLVAQWCEQELRKAGDRLDCPYVIKTAFTGAAASIIGGQTLHSSFKLHFTSVYTSLGDKMREMLRDILQNLRIRELITIQFFNY